MPRIQTMVRLARLEPWGPDPDTHVAFEAQADLMMARMAGAEIALDARDALAELQAVLAVHPGPVGVGVPPPRPARASERQRVLVTFSTTVMEGQLALIGRVCDAVARLDLDAVLTLGPAIDRDAVRVPDNVEVAAFAEHDGLMPKCAAVIGHGGLGTVRRALAHGLPQLLLPLGRDQAFNASRVEQLQAGSDRRRIHHRADPDRPAPAADRAAICSSGRARRQPHRGR